MLEVTAAGWIITIGVVALLFAVDFAIAALRPHTVGFRESALWSAFYIGIAIAFGFIFMAQAGTGLGTEYFAGYLVEKSLSIDNLFVFAIIISTFAVPEKYQHKVLTFGILIALMLRGVFIAIGAALISVFTFAFLLFGLLLIWTAVQLFRHRDQDPDIEENVVVKTTRKVMPVSEDYIGGKMITRENGQRVITPLLIVLIALGTTDVLFALDSIPAVYGVTEEPFIVFAANAFALLGLRALFFLVTGLLDRLVYLSTGLSLVLGFIGVKLILEFGHEEISESFPEPSIGFSLGLIAAILTVTSVASIIKVRRDPSARAHAGSLRLTDRASKQQQEADQSA